MPRKHPLLFSLIGWLGVIAIALAYALLIFGVFEGQDVVYLLLNVAGSVAIMIEAWNVKNYQPVVLNMFWALIALISLLSILL